MAEDHPETRYQFERLGYFWRDPVDGATGGASASELVFNRIVALKDGFGARREERAARSDERARPEPTAVTASGAGASSAGTSRAGASDAAPDAPAETPMARALRERHGLSVNDAGVLAANPELATFFEETVAAGADAAAAAPWVVNEVARMLRESGGAATAITPLQLAELVALVAAGSITNRVAKDLLEEVGASGASPREVVAQRGLDRRLAEADLEAAVAEALAASPAELASYRAGKVGLRGFFVGQVMRKTKGQADPEVVQRLVAAALDEG